MALFRRSNRDSVPAEIQEYYDAEKPQRVGAAWLLGLVSLLLTILVILGLFFGGRYVYRKIVHRNKPATVSTQTTSQTGQSTQTLPQNSGFGSNSSGNNSTTAPSTSSSPATGSGNTTTGGQASGNSATTTQPSTSTSPTPTPSSPSTSSSSSTGLPNTGPSNTLAIFVIGAAVGVTFYQLRLRFASKSH